jgi:P-type Cu+ transporter
MNKNPGRNGAIKVRADKFAFLDDQKIASRLITFTNDSNTHITFYLPQVHCSSCLWVLEHVRQLNKGIISSKLNFTSKEISLVLNHNIISVRQVAELLTSIGYEPYISLNDLAGKKPRIGKGMLLQLGVAGFCFANIMLLSFPEYLGIEHADGALLYAFRYLGMVLSLPVVLFSALPFYRTAWGALKQRHLNMDAAIVLAILVTFFRSIYEVISGSGSGYFDSMSGIVFFMLIGRMLQERAYHQLSFDRDYTSYFPIAITVLKDNREIPTALPDVKCGDTLIIHNQQLIPADGIAIRGRAWIDYSFVTGESVPVRKNVGDIVYAGGNQTGGSMELLVVKEVSNSYLASLWERDAFRKNSTTAESSFVQQLARYFTWIVLTISLIAGIYWWVNDGSRIWTAATAVLIVACPCALLLSNTFTNGNILRILSRNKFYLRNAQVIENIAKASTIVFDKTGTLTAGLQFDVQYYGEQLLPWQTQAIASLAAQSLHPLSIALANHLQGIELSNVYNYTEVLGKGVEGTVDNCSIAIGSKQFVMRSKDAVSDPATRIYVAINGRAPGYFQFTNQYRDGSYPLVSELKKTHQLAVLSGDSTAERANLRKLFGKNATLLFEQDPHDKLTFIKSLQQQGEAVIMVGDGLNDAGALKQSDAGIAVTDDVNNFTPSSDAILAGSELGKLPKFIRLCRANKRIVVASFVLSIVYNITGLYFAVQGNLSPLIAAILMPASSISILLVTFGCSSFAARLLGLIKQTDKNHQVA